jgi:type VI secretion system protein VasG
MMPVELKPLLGRLNRCGARALESAAGVCVSRSHYEVTADAATTR